MHPSLLSQLEPLQDVLSVIPKSLLAGVAGLVLLYVVWRIFFRRRRKSSIYGGDLSIDVTALETGDWLPIRPTLEFYNVPVRLAAIVLAPVGRVGKLPSAEKIRGVLDAIVPGLAEVVIAHQSTFFHWPPQLSSSGFSHALFRHVPLPGDRGKGTPWCTAAGGFKVNGKPIMAALIMRAESPNSLGQFAVESESKWLDMFRVKA